MTRKSEIQIIGVHALHVTTQLVDVQYQLLYDYPMSKEHQASARKRCRAQLNSIVLIETHIKRPDDHFSVHDFTQAQPGIPRDKWQAPYLVSFLDVDGSTRIECELGETPKRDYYRCAFYLHFFQDGKPLNTSYGERFCPAKSEMPDRLKRLVPFQPVD